MNSERPSGHLDHFALWFSLGASLYLMPFGALLVPALSIERAVLATAVAALLAGLVVGVIAAVAASSGRSSLDLLADAFGQRARLPLSALLVGRHMLFIVFALVVMADSAELVSDRALGAGLRPLWVAVFGAIAAALVLAGPDRVATGMRRAGVWLVLLVAVGVAASAYAEFEIPSYLRRPAAGGWPAFWQAVDVMLIFPLLWLPVAADFAVRGRAGRPAALGSFGGISLATLWFGALGILYLPATDSGDIPGFVVGMQLGLGALVLLLLLQVDEIYASARSLAPVLGPVVSPALLTLAPAVLIAAALPEAVLLRTADLEGYVILVGSVFIPAFAVVIARNVLSYRRPAAAAALAWAAGFIAYQWVSPAEIGWWNDVLDSLFAGAGLGFPLSESATWLSAALASLAIAIAVDSAPALLRVVPGRRLPATRAES